MFVYSVHTPPLNTTSSMYIHLFLHVILAAWVDHRLFVHHASLLLAAPPSIPPTYSLSPQKPPHALFCFCHKIVHWPKVSAHLLFDASTGEDIRSNQERERERENMERSGKLVQLTLVSKYYPVANYSYPRSEGAPTPYNSRRSSNEPGYSSSISNCNCNHHKKRASTDLQQQQQQPSPLSPPPSLIDDRTDSETSSADDDDDNNDNDSRYRADADELWDSFLESEHYHIHDSYRKKVAAMAAAAAAASSFDAAPSCIPPKVPEKDYPALIPSPQCSRRRPQGSSSSSRSQGSHSWPLSDHQQHHHHGQTSHHARKPSPTYSAFPKIMNMSSRTQYATSQTSPPQLSMPNNSLLPTLHAPPVPPRPSTSHNDDRRSGSLYPRGLSPSSLRVLQRPATSHGSRPTSPLGFASPSPPPTAPLPSLPPLSARTSSRSPARSFQTTTCTTTQPQHHRLQVIQPKIQTLRPYKSTAQLHPPPPPPPCPPPAAAPEPLPVSVFEYDSDSDCDDGDSDESDSATEFPTLSFFRFHRRSQSPNHNSGILTLRRGSASKATPAVAVVAPTTYQNHFLREDAAPKEPRRRRKNTMESLKQADVINRMLGRRSR